MSEKTLGTCRLKSTPMETLSAVVGPGVGAEGDGVGWYVKHDVAAASDKAPDGQASHAAAPDEGCKRPAVHATQPVAPVLGW